MLGPGATRAVSRSRKANPFPQLRPREPDLRDVAPHQRLRGGCGERRREPGRRSQRQRGNARTDPRPEPEVRSRTNPAAEVVVLSQILTANLSAAPAIVSGNPGKG